MLTQTDKGKLFQKLHGRRTAFIIPNPWDIGTARLLARSGFEALATTSGGHAFSMGRQDGTISRVEMMAHVSAIASATDLPVSADLENGFGNTPEIVAETVKLAATAGAVGCSIEDRSRDDRGLIYDHAYAVERVCAAAETVRNLSFPFLLTARAENYLVGRPDLPDTIKRLQAYQEAGADVLYAPGLTTKEDIAAVVGSVDRPVNVVMGGQGVPLALHVLSEVGVKRVSIGSSLSRASLSAFLHGAQEMLEHGTFTFANNAVSYPEINAMFET